MATYTWTGSGNWGTTTNWTPNGTPLITDTVLFSSANNNNCTVAAAANAQILNLQDYRGAITINSPQTLTVAGNITLSNATVPPGQQVGIVGPGNLAVSANSTITSNGKTIDALLRFVTVGTTIQLADAMILTRGLICFGTPLGSMNLISSTPGVQRSLIFTNNGITAQEIDYLNVTDIDGSLGLTVWTYKGVVTNSPNWFTMLTQPPTVSSITFC
jgi:hypothetical protein